MKHLHRVSRPAPPSLAATTTLEALILLFVQATFSQWDNFSGVYQNLSKFYSKT